MHAEPERIEVGGLRLRHWPGSGRPRVFVHGWAMHGGLFAELIDELDPRPAYALDLPGHGDNRDVAVPLEPAAVATALAPLGPADWIGWSLGGLFAIAAATAAQATSLTLIASLPRFVAGADWPHGMPEATFAGFANDLARDWHGTVDRFLTLEALGDADERALMQRLRRQVYAHGEPDPAALSVGLALLHTRDARADLAAIAATGLPIRLIGGRRDRLVSPAALAATAALHPAIRSHIIPGAAHAPFMTHAAEVAAQLRG
ncbi:MAG: alpha/beta fold hydrolase [Xanthomonadales bacterium]|jgi:pimeloyl-[acyl-carrier protein] methyl ester esterase|nr:alpha/beta fold hydrolase [Xanthomonadales bacterium]